MLRVYQDNLTNLNKMEEELIRKRAKIFEQLSKKRFKPSYPVLVHFLNRAPLTEEQHLRFMNETAITINNIPVRLECLFDGRELNDEVINTYFDLFDSSFVYTYSSHFYAKLTQGGRYDFNNTKSWMPKLKVFRALLFPLHVHDNHWILAAADMRTKKLLVYDSMCDAREGSLGKYGQIIPHLLQYLFELTNARWRWIQMICPQQVNPFDCGVYCCTFGFALLMWYNNNAWHLPPYFEITPSDIRNQRRHIKLNLLG